MWAWKIRPDSRVSLGTGHASLRSLLAAVAEAAQGVPDTNQRGRARVFLGRASDDLQSTEGADAID